MGFIAFYSYYYIRNRYNFNPALVFLCEMR